MADYFKRARGALCCALVCSGSMASTGLAEEVVRQAPTVDVESAAPGAAAQLDPMGLDGVEPRLAYVLRRYYENSLGGAESWRKIQSVRFEGDLRLPQGSFSFVAYKKKPNYCKVVLLGPKGGRVVMAYDGQDAWQLNTRQSALPTTMPPAEALDFIRDATTGGHLLDPTLPEKRIELLGTQRVGQESCRNVRVTLPNGQQVTYAIGVTSFAELRQTVVNAVSGDVEVTTHARTQEVDGLLIPMQSTMTVNGEFRHEVLLRSAEVNVGVMPWMFSRPSVAYIPGSVPPVGAIANDGGQQRPADEGVLGAEGSAFNVEPSGFEDSGASRFQDLDGGTKQSILEELDSL